MSCRRVKLSKHSRLNLRTNCAGTVFLSAMSKRAVRMVRKRSLAQSNTTKCRWFFSNAHREAGSELALAGHADGRLTNVIIDPRTFVDADGTRWAIGSKEWVVTKAATSKGSCAMKSIGIAGRSSALLALARGLGPRNR